MVRFTVKIEDHARESGMTIGMSPLPPDYKTVIFT